MSHTQGQFPKALLSGKKEQREIFLSSTENPIQRVTPLKTDHQEWAPNGHVIRLPVGATPLDFAYRIHTDLGHRYTGAKVGNHLVRLDYKLKNGDIVELMTSRTRKGPSPEWLSVRKDEEGKRYYMYARTRQARSKIRHWFRTHNETQKTKT